jgi:hypothetical protein
MKTGMNRIHESVDEAVDGRPCALESQEARVDAVNPEVGPAGRCSAHRLPVDTQPARPDRIDESGMFRPVEARGDARDQRLRGGRSIERGSFEGRTGGSGRRRHASLSTKRGSGGRVRHHSSLATGPALNGDCDGNDRFEQWGPEHGRAGAGAPGERSAAA